MDDEKQFAKRLRSAFHVCQMQLMLMEEALRELALERGDRRAHPTNRGWMNLFRRWSHAPTFRRAWAISISDYPAALQAFCEYALGLKAEASVRRCSADELTLVEQMQAGYIVQEVCAKAEVYLAEIAVWSQLEQNAARVAVGMAVVDASGCEPRLLLYRLRDEYRGMGLLRDMLRALAQSLEADVPSATLRADPPDAVREMVERNADVLREVGFEVTRRAI